MKIVANNTEAEQTSDLDGSLALTTPASDESMTSNMHFNEPALSQDYESMAHVSPIHPLEEEALVDTLVNEEEADTITEQQTSATLEQPEDPDRPFDISEFKGPNLSEDEEDDDSDAELGGGSKRSKTLTPLVFSDVDMEANSTDKNQFNLDLNGHETYFDRIQSPDMANYEHLLQGSHRKLFLSIICWVESIF